VTSVDVEEDDAFEDDACEV